MDVKKIRFLTTLKAGRVYPKGKIMDGPFPSQIMEELRAIASGKINPPTIEVLERLEAAPPPSPTEETPVEEAVPSPSDIEEVPPEADTKLAAEQTIIEDDKTESSAADEKITGAKTKNEKPKKKQSKPPIRKK